MGGQLAGRGRCRSRGLEGRYSRSLGSRRGLGGGEEVRLDRRVMAAQPDGDGLGGGGTPPAAPRRTSPDPRVHVVSVGISLASLDAAAEQVLAWSAERVGR